MKFSCERDHLIKEIGVAQEIISSRNVLSILSNVRLETVKDRLVIRATDLKVGFEASVPVEVVDEGTTTVYCDKFLGILKALPTGDVEFELKENMIMLIKPVFKKIDFQLKSIASEKYPELQQISDEHYFKFPQADLVKMIASTIFAVSDDETRYFMNGIYLEKVEDKIVMVASDGRRLSYISKQMDPAVEDINGIIIPPKILAMLRRLLPGEGDVELCFTDKFAFAKYGTYRLSSNLIEGQFPNYQRVIPESQEHTAVIQRELLENALKRVSLLVEQKSRRIFLKLQEDNLIISSEESEIGMAKEEIPCQYGGPENIIALNYLYLIEPLREMHEENILVEFTDPNKAITVKEAPESDSQHIVMPMQMK
jgi:DNA polymerase-3 subunit beta